MLVSPNITCVLSDFGFAMKMPEIGLTKSTDDIITEVGLNTCSIAMNSGMIQNQE